MRDKLLAAIQLLNESFADRCWKDKNNWARCVSGVLAQVEGLLRHHTVDAYCPTGLLHVVDPNRPAQARQARRLCREHGDFLERIQAIQAEIARGQAAAVAGASGPGPGSEVGEAIDAESLRQSAQRQAEKLLADLSRHWEREADLVIESVIQEIGGRFHSVYDVLDMVPERNESNPVTVAWQRPPAQALQYAGN